MIDFFIKKILGSKNDREIKKLSKYLSTFQSLEAEMKTLTEDAMRERTAALRTQAKEDHTDVTALIPEAFALIREASRRLLNMRHFDVQMLGGLVLHSGKIAEMRTGEGKTLVATLAAYLNALSGRGVHIVTVNDYLSQRDAEWMWPVYEMLGLSVGRIYSSQSHESKKEAYQADITYGTNNEFGFDYLRDNMVLHAEEKVQRALHYAIIDEVDSILIDEARTPLIISGVSEDSSALYIIMNRLATQLTEDTRPEQSNNPLHQVKQAQDDTQDEGVTGHYRLDSKQNTVELTEEGYSKVEAWLIDEGILKPGDSLYAPEHLGKLQHVQQAIRAHRLFKRNVEYLVRAGEVVIVDEYTGRAMPGRRWGEGLHQAVEAKEGLQIQPESKTLASTTFQNYFRLYDKLSGMTGTAETEAFEFRHIYQLDVVAIPPNQVVTRQDFNDLVYLTNADKQEAIVKEIQDCLLKKQPVLVGTTSIENSEQISQLLKRKGVGHQVLNAKHHEREAQIIAEAGRPGAVTIATNMAGRGTDIVLGGHIDPDESSEKEKQLWEERNRTVISAGGLHVIGTERHESRRVDNQLRGRSGRQGDPGSTRFFLSLDDSLMRIFATDRTQKMLRSLGLHSGESIEHAMVSRAIEKAQSRVENRNFEMRKQLLEYDDVASEQRCVIYDVRNHLLTADTVSDSVSTMIQTVLQRAIDAHVAARGVVDAKQAWLGFDAVMHRIFGFKVNLTALEGLDAEAVYDQVLEDCHQCYQSRFAQLAPEVLGQLERQVLLRMFDTFWKEHLSTLDYLRQGIHLRGYAQKNPKQEYKREAFRLFSDLLINIDDAVVRCLYHLQLRASEAKEQLLDQPADDTQLSYERTAAPSIQDEVAVQSAALSSDVQQTTAQTSSAPYVRTEKKVGRNQPCPCQSGKKYKHCHGKDTVEQRTHHD